jgi:ERF superfamily
MRTSESLKEFAPAMVKVQADIKHAIKDSTNPHFKSAYADLQAVTEACRPALVKHGFSVMHGVDSGDGSTVTVTARVLHQSGEWVESSLTLRPTKADPQGIGSAITYARRYTLAAIVGVATEDDDGNAASVPTVPPPASRATAPRPATNGAANGHAQQPASRRSEFVAKVRKWTGVQPEDLPGVIGKIKTALDIRGDATEEQTAAMIEFIDDNAGRKFEEVLK